MTSVESMIKVLSIYIITIEICTAQDPNCLNGLLSSDGSVCAPSFCSQVCGTGCGNAGPDGNCCCGQIESSGMSCIFHDSPCIMPPINPQQDNTDIYGITKIYKSIYPSKLDFDPNWINAPSRSFVDGTDPYSTDGLCHAHGSERSFDIDGTTGIMTNNGSPRYYCYLEHLNVEVTAYAKRGSETSFLEYQGFTIGARSNHRDTGSNYCKARGYYFRLYNNGDVCFVKEFIHSYDKEIANCLIYGEHEDNPCTRIDGGQIEKNKWYGMKFIVQNDNNNVNLLGYIDYDDGINGGNWQLVLEYTDTYPSPWKAIIATDDAPNCMNTCDYNGDENWNEASNSIFLRTDKQEDYQWKKFSVREITPFQKF